MHRNIKLFIALSTLFLSMCTFYDQGGAVVAPNGLSCQSRTDYGIFQRQRSAQCYYKCPDGTVRQPEIDGDFSASSPLYSASQAEVNAQFCQGTIASTSTLPPTDFPTMTAEAEEAETPVPPTEQAIPSATPELSISNLPPLLRGDVTMCDVAGNLINFRMIEPVPDLTVKSLEVQIADQPSTCTVNPTNTSLLTCTIPPSVLFPARVFVRLDNAVVNDFIYDGLGCAKLATPLSGATP